MIKKLKYKNKEIEYIICRKNIKNINIRIVDKIVKVSANNRVSTTIIESAIIKNAEKILKQLERAPNRYIHQVNHDYIDGEKLLYLGEYYEIKIINSHKNEVVLNKEILVYTENILNKQIVKKMIEFWYMEEMYYIFEDSLKRNYELIKRYTEIIPKLKYRKMAASWGNCRMPSGVITMNKNLIKAPIDCIDYVMAHELVHLVYQNHGKEFYNLLNDIMPDWKIRKKSLENR